VRVSATLNQEAGLTAYYASRNWTFVCSCALRTARATATATSNFILLNVTQPKWLSTKRPTIPLILTNLPHLLSRPLAALNSLEHRHTLHTRKLCHPAIMLLVDTVLHNTLVADSRLLRLQATTVSPHAALSIVHSLLQRVVLPAEDVVAVLAVARVVSRGEVEGLRAVGGPVGFVVEFGCVPYDLGGCVSLGGKERGGDRVPRA
jgi:hypothetical protein